MSYSVKLTEQALGFLNELETKLRAKAYRTIGLLKSFGRDLRMPHSRKIVGAKELYELRVKQGANICRLFYFEYKGDFFIALSGYVKKSQSADKGEIEKALLLLQEIKEASYEEY
jgi:phage-related protein